MADSRSTTFAVDFENGGAVSGLTDMEDALDAIDGMTDLLGDDLKGITKGLADTGLEGDKAFKSLMDNAKDTGATFEGAGALLDDALGKGIIRVDSFGDAFKATMGASLKHGQSFTKGLQMGFKGFFAYSKNSLKEFGKDFADKAKSVGTAFRHPIQTLKDKLSSALLRVKKDTGELGGEADKSGKDLKEMGDKGGAAADKIKGAIGNAVKAFLGFQAIKAAGQAIANFAKSAVAAFQDTEAGAAKFGAVFKGDTATEEWAGNFSKSVKRANSEVKSFLVSNKGMYDAMGMTSDQATKLSQDTTELAYDFGNAFKMSDADALGLMQDAIKGNAEALTEYGVKLDESTLKAKAKSMGITKELKDIDDATMAQVRLNAIMEQTADIQGKAGASGGSLTNSIKNVKGTLMGFLESAGGKLAPTIDKVLGTVMDMWPKIEPGLMKMVDLLANGLADALPVLADLAGDLLPSLSDILGVVFEVLTPLIPVFGELLKAILPPLAGILGTLVRSLLPPIVGIIEALMPTIETLMNILIPIVNSLLPPLGSLLKAITPILNAIAPILQLIGDLLLPIVEFVGKIIEWVAGGIGKVADFFGGLFGGAKKSKGAVAELNDDVDELAGKTVETKVAVTTPEQVTMPPLNMSAQQQELDQFNGGIENSKTAIQQLSADANKLELDLPVPDTAAYTGEVLLANKEIEESSQNLNKAVEGQLKALSDMSQASYDAVGTHAETAWARAVEAARVGTGKIVGYIGKVNGLGTVSVSVSSPVPHNAKGTDNFEGGWTHINEEGGEVAFLPQGSAIIPADQSEQMIENAQKGASGGGSRTVKKEVTHNITVTVNGEGIDPETLRSLKAEITAAVRQQLQEDRADEEEFEIVQDGYAA